jgi:hypothetical protein
MWNCFQVLGARFHDDERKILAAAIFGWFLRGGRQRALDELLFRWRRYARQLRRHHGQSRGRQRERRR